MKTVTSRENAALKAARRLKDRHGRDKEGAFLVEGSTLIREAAAAGLEVRSVFVRADAWERLQARAVLDDVPALASDISQSGGACGGLADILTLGSSISQSGVRANLTEATELAALLDQIGQDRLLRVADALYGELASTATPQPVMAVVGKPVAARDFSAAAGAVAARKGKDANALAILVLDRIQDPGNVGTAIRTALAAGFDLVAAVKGTADLWSDKVIRGAAGSLFRMTVVEGLRTEDCIGGIRGVGAALCVCAADGEDCFSSDLSGGCALVVGNESGGASQAFMDNADRIVGIPMEKGAESLNAAVAAAIIMYEKRRQDSVRADGCRTS